MMDVGTVAGLLDLANHHQDATPEKIRQLCQQVQEFHLHAAFVNPCFVSLAREALAGGVVGTVISFPLGQDETDVKALAAMKAVRDGADELDVSMNVGWFKAGKKELVLNEMRAVVATAKESRVGTIVKFIIETGWLEPGEIKAASELVLESGADFVKTCSGMGPRGAEINDVQLIREVIGSRLKVKVAGGIHDFATAVAFIEAGADQIGTSKAVEIVSGEMKDKGKELRGGR